MHGLRTNLFRDVVLDVSLDESLDESAPESASASSHSQPESASSHSQPESGSASTASITLDDEVLAEGIRVPNWLPQVCDLPPSPITSPCACI